ncbi:unnamed protein product [Lactuca virosa]|uniref:F-box domain-containing protein n=1 Tax=Lactuca virosa TaxID=75947 RepID=A0AAU9MYE2_9ASTR|nr:unnamed protein product [Lactuca virosa]
MVNTRSMTRNENHNASSQKRFKTCDDDDDPAPWSDLNHELLFTVMMQLGVVDFPGFSGVCKSWRSFALSNKNKFMESRPPMSVSIFTESNEQDYNYYLDDINTEGRSFNSILPHSGGRICVGFTCGHLILFGSKTRDFWLLDPVTRHGVHFRDIPSSVSDDPAKIKGVLVISPSKSGWVFVMTDGSTNIWYSISGQGEWNYVSSTSPIVDLHTLNGKDQFFKSCESLYVMGCLPEGYYFYHKLDFEEMEWVLCKSSRKGGPSSSHKKLKTSAPVKHGKANAICVAHWHVVMPTKDLLVVFSFE